MCDNEVLIFFVVGFNCVLFCFFFLLFNKYNSVEVINKVDDVLIMIVKIIGIVKFFMVLLLKIVIGNNVNSVVMEVNIVWFNVLFMVLLMVFVNGLFGFKCNNLWMWLSIIILLFIE